jgi:hypothetical protein
MFATFGGFHMRKILCAVLCCAAVIVSGSAIADDSSASLAMGGLQFTKSADIRMAREDLFLSPKAVRIRYEFTNDGARDVDTLVAFPLPDIDLWEFYEEPIGTVGSDPVNFVNFKAVADGKNVPVTVEQRAYLGNRDVTAIVKSVGLPVNVLLAGNIAVIDKLAPEKKKILEKAGLAEADAPDQEHPKWTVRTKFYWTQHFSAGKTVVLEHSYTPVTGQTFFVPDDLKPNNTGEGGHDWQKDYCMDAGTLSAIRARMADRKPGQDAGMLNIYSTGFILKTANNWKGGIGTLHLTIDKLKPANVLSLCWAGDLKKTGATTFESTLTNVQPKRDISFVVLE